MLPDPNDKSYPVYSFADLEKAKKLAGTRRPPAVNIPRNMTIENYYGMNLLPGHRIGLGQREQYIAKLSEAYIDGYLTEEEYDKRTDWVNSAQTIEQIEVAFHDLQQSLLNVKIKQYLDEPGKELPNLAVPNFLFVIIAGVFSFGITIESIAGSWIGALILFTEMILIITFLYRAKRKHGGQG